MFHNFVRFVAVTNVVFFLVSLIAWVRHLRATFPRLHAAGLGWRHSSELVGSQLLNVFFLSSFQPSSDPYWEAMVSTACAFSLLTGPIYFCVSLWIFKDASREQLIVASIRNTPLDRRCWCGRSMVFGEDGQVGVVPRKVPED